MRDAKLRAREDGSVKKNLSEHAATRLRTFLTALSNGGRFIKPLTIVSVSLAEFRTTLNTPFADLNDTE